MPTNFIHTLSGWFADDQLMALIILMIAVALLTLSMRRRRWPSQTPLPPPPPKIRPAPSPSTTAMRRDMDDLLVELQDLSRRISAEIDTRFAKLEAAMKDADRRIAVLNRLGRTNGEAANSPVPAAARSTEPVRQDQDVRYTIIYELADAGFAPVEIARELGRTPGEVELILNLRRQASNKP